MPTPHRNTPERQRTLAARKVRQFVRGARGVDPHHKPGHANIPGGRRRAMERHL